MIPLAMFLLACAAVYLGAIEAAFSALMRLSLRLVAERTNRPGALGTYLDDPLLLFVPVRLLLGLVIGTATALFARVLGVEGAHTLPAVIAAVAAFVVICELLLPLVIAGRDPERVLELLLPTFAPVARAIGPVTRWIARSVSSSKRGAPSSTPDETAEEANDVAKAYIESAEQEGLIEGEERRLLQSIVDFGDALVREVMTPRPDIVAIREDASIGELRTLFREQEYSRFPVYRDSLDNIAGFVFIKDLVVLGPAADDLAPIKPLVRPASVVPETKRVPELLKQFQRQQTQCAIVVDEYGGTAGLVTIEDLLEEIVGEIRDEYDVESEPIVDEGNGRIVFSGKVNVDEITQRLNIEIEGEGFETVGGYLMHRIGRVPAAGETFEIDGLTVEVLDAERRRINKVRMRKSRGSATEDTEAAAVKNARHGHVSVKAP
jgi:CBS domain containing-hemolysin-like protein